MKAADVSLMTAVLDTMEDGVYLVRPDFTVAYSNRAMEKHFGRGPGDRCYQVFHRRRTVCPWCGAAAVFGGQSLQREVFLEQLDRGFDFSEMPFRAPDGSKAKLGIWRDISKRKEYEQRFQDSCKEFQSLFEHVDCGVFISSREGKFLNVNRALTEMLGYANKEDLINIDLSRDLYVDPEERRRFQEMIETQGRVVDYEVEFKRRDGRPLSVLLTARPRYDHQGRVIGYEGINVDQTQRKLMEKELKEAHDFMNKIIQSSPNAIIATDMKGNILIFNRAAEQTLGYQAREVIGRMHITKIYPEGMAQKIMRLMRGPQHGGKGVLQAYPVVFFRRDGEDIDVNLSAAIIYDAHGKELASVGIFVDLRERLAMESKLRETREQLLHSEKLAAMGRLTSQLAHELNNPLYGIMNTLELLKSEVPPENKRRKLLDMSLSETVRLAEMLRKMLSFSKPDQEERRSVNINTVLDEILLLHHKQFQENGIRINSDFRADPDVVYASSNQLRQVFLNMLNNARDAMPEGGTFSVVTQNTEGQVAVELADTGVGIREENLDRIFDSFFTTKNSVKGVGLGLSVCYGFIRDHGGDIKVSSKPNEGTTFTITLPLQGAPDAVEQTPGSRPPAA